MEMLGAGKDIASVREVVEEERLEIKKLRCRRKNGPAQDAPTVGLAFSGGGIRSATINLGIVQALAKYGLLKRIDYLSTVSGGGYIGAWLARWIYERGVNQVEDRLAGRVDPEKVEPAPVTFLRDYSNYLTPRKGLLGADTWAAIATWFRNVLLNQVILIGFLAVVMYLPWMLGSVFEYGSLMERKPLLFAAAAGLLVIWATAWGVVHTSTCAGMAQEAKRRGDEDPKHWEWTSQRNVLLWVVLPLFAGAFCLNYIIFREPDTWRIGYCLTAGLLVYVAGHLIGCLASRLKFGWNTKGLPSFWNVFWALPSGALAGYEIYGLKLFIARWFEDPIEGKWHAASWGPPLFVLAFLLAGALHIGLAKFALRVEIHEWWARLGGWLLLWGLVWAAAFTLTIFVPLAVFYLGVYTSTPILWGKGVAFVGWLSHSLLGARLGWSKNTSGSPGSNSLKEWIAKLAPFVFVAGLLVLLAAAVHAGAMKVNGFSMDDAFQAARDNPADRDQQWWIFATAFRARRLLLLAGALSALTAILSWRVDINRFSMNLLYRNRLVRCYLGASNEHRHAQRFTGFDPADDLFLACFTDPSACDPDEPEERRQGYNGPYPILNATLNLTHGQRLGWQERKAESFIMTPNFCGFDFPEMQEPGSRKLAQGKGAQQGGYHRTIDWAMPDQGILLGTAVTISGAAISPNMGFHTYPPLAFLMTVFNVRLGEWLANPRFRNEQFLESVSRVLTRVQKTVSGEAKAKLAFEKKVIASPEGGPRSSLLYLLCELFGTTTDVSKYVYLTDGAHFENLGLYELVRRECDFIFASDAGEDPGYVFSDLANAIRKCRTDLGAEITLKLAPIAADPQTRLAKYHAIRGEIRYRGGQKVGQLLYFKSCLTGNEPNDVKDYWRLHSEFPQQSTANQWFDESQFESYRALGFLAADSILDRCGEPFPSIERAFACAPLE